MLDSATLLSIRCIWDTTSSGWKPGILTWLPGFLALVTSSFRPLGNYKMIFEKCTSKIKTNMSIDLESCCSAADISTLLSVYLCKMILTSHFLNSVLIISCGKLWCTDTENYSWELTSDHTDLFLYLHRLHEYPLLGETRPTLCRLAAVPIIQVSEFVSITCIFSTWSCRCA